MASSFILNGCLVDKIKARVYSYKNPKKSKTISGIVEQKSFIRTQPKRITSTVSQQVAPKVTTRQKVVKEVATVVVSEKEATTVSVAAKEVKKVEQKSVTKKVAKKVKVKKSKHVTKKVTKRKKVIKRKVKQKSEPYSIEKNENDPELLGPQTTLDSNPLSKS